MGREKAQDTLYPDVMVLSGRCQRRCGVVGSSGMGAERGVGSAGMGFPQSLQCSGGGRCLLEELGVSTLGLVS